jgi:hypothetical protein
MNTTDLTFLVRSLRRPQGVVLDDTEHRDAAIAWLLRVQDLTPSGGIAGFYSILHGWYDAYPETTGYIIQTLVDYASRTGNETIMLRAAALGDWEIGIQFPDGGVRGFCLKRGLSDQPMIFDTGQVLFGWTALYRATGEKRFLDAALKGALWLRAHQESDGRWATHIYRNHCGTYHARVAWAMLQVARDAHHEELHQSALAFLRWVLRGQSASGFFPLTGFMPEANYFTHAISYTIEGLLGAAEELRGHPLEADLVASALRGCTKFTEISLQSRSLYGEYRPDFTPATTRYLCVPGVAQIAWCLLKAYTYSGDPRHFGAAVKLLDSVKSMQMMTTTNPDFYGSLPGSVPIWGSYQRWRIVTWGAKFLADALLEKERISAAPSMVGQVRPTNTP